MTDKVCDRKLYKIPSNEILNNRRKFYGLKRENAETIQNWLGRFYDHIDDCDFPKSIEFILADRLLCELATTERNLIRKAFSSLSMIFEFVSIKK